MMPLLGERRRLRDSTRGMYFVEKNSIYLFFVLLSTLRNVICYVGWIIFVARCSKQLRVVSMF